MPQNQSSFVWALVEFNSGFKKSIAYCLYGQGLSVNTTLVLRNMDENSTAIRSISMFRRDHAADQLHLPLDCDGKIGIDRRSHVFMAKVHRPRLEAFRILAQLIAQMGQGLAERMWCVLWQLHGSKCTLDDRVQLGRIGKRFPRQSKIGEPLPIYHTDPGLWEQGILWTEQFDLA